MSDLTAFRKAAFARLRVSRRSTRQAVKKSGDVQPADDAGRDGGPVANPAARVERERWSMMQSD
jgi:hypothetical protein